MKVRYRILSYGKLFRVQFNCGLGWVDYAVTIDGTTRTILFDSFEEAKEVVVSGFNRSWTIVEEGEQYESSRSRYDQHTCIGFYEDQETDGYQDKG